MIIFINFEIQSTLIHLLETILMTTANKRLSFILLAIPLLLLIPFTAMQFSNEVNWSIADFLVMGVLLLSVGLFIELFFRRVKNQKQRIMICISAVFVFLLIWAELAVGIFGTPFAGS